MSDTPNDNALHHLLKNEQVPRAVFDFIRHNLGLRSAYAAVGMALPPAERPCAQLARAGSECPHGAPACAECACAS